MRYSEYTVPAWFNSLYSDSADFAVAGRGAYLSELKAFEKQFGYPPLEITIATGGFDKRKGNTPGVIFFVNKDNPLTRVTLDQLDGNIWRATNGWLAGERTGRLLAPGARKKISEPGVSWASPENGRTNRSLSMVWMPRSAVGLD